MNTLFKKARDSSSNSRVNYDINACDDIREHALLNRRPKSRNNFYAQTGLDIQTSSHLQAVGRSPMIPIEKATFLSQSLNPTITGTDRITGYNDKMLDEFQTNQTETLRLYNSMLNLLEENTEICETTLKSKNNLPMQTIPYLMGMNKNMSSVVNSLKLNADHQNNGLLLAMNPDQNLHRYIYMGYIRQQILELMIARKPNSYIDPIQVKGQLINTAKDDHFIMNHDVSMVTGEKLVFCDQMTFKQRKVKPIEENMFFPSIWGQHYTDMCQNYTAFTHITNSANDVYINTSEFANMTQTENAKQSSVYYVTNGHQKDENLQIDLSEATLQTIRFGALMLSTIQEDGPNQNGPQWWTKVAQVNDIVNNLECEQFSISSKLNNGLEKFKMDKKTLTNVVQDTVDKWCEDTDCGYILSKDDLNLFKQNPTCSHIFKMLQVCKNIAVIKNTMNITGKHVTEENEQEFIEKVLPNLQAPDWQLLVSTYLKCYYIPLTKLLRQGQKLRTDLINVYTCQLTGELDQKSANLYTSFTVFIPNDMNYTTKVYLLVGSYVNDKASNDWTMIPGTVFDFNLGKNRDFNPEDIEPDLESLNTVDTDNYQPADILNSLFIHEYTQAENKNQISKNVGEEFSNDVTQRCVKVDPKCIRTDRNALLDTESIEMFEQGNNGETRLDGMAQFTNTLTDEHSQLGSNLSILIKGRYTATMNRMTGYLKNEETALGFFNSHPDLKQLMGVISQICCAERHKPKVVITQYNSDKDVPATEEPTSFMYMRFFMLNQLLNLAASYLKNKAKKPEIQLEQYLPFTMKETPNCQPNQPVWVDKLENLYGEKVNVNCNALVVKLYIDFFEYALNLFNDKGVGRTVTLETQDKQALAGYITIANHFLFSVTTLDLVGGNTVIKKQSSRKTNQATYYYEFNPIIGIKMTDQQENAITNCPQIYFFQRYRAVTPSGSRHVNVLANFDRDVFFKWIQASGNKVTDTFSKHFKTLSAYDALVNLNAVSDATADLKFKTIDNFMPVRYKDITKNVIVQTMLTVSQKEMQKKKYSFLEHILGLTKCTEIFRTLHISSLNAMKLIESCALGITGAIPVYYVDSQKIVRNLTQTECTKIYKYLNDSKTISDQMIDMGKKLFQAKWLVKHLQPFEAKDTLPILNCMFSTKFNVYMQNQWCPTEDFYNQLQGKKILTQKGWELNPACTPRKELLDKFRTKANAPNDIGLVDDIKKSFFSFCSSQTLCKAYQYTIFHQVKASLYGFQYANGDIFDCQLNSRTLKIVGNINRKLGLLKDDKIKNFNLTEKIADQCAKTVDQLAEVVDFAQKQDNQYLKHLELQEDSEEEQPSEQSEEEDVEMKGNEQPVDQTEEEEDEVNLNDITLEDQDEEPEMIQEVSRPNTRKRSSNSQQTKPQETPQDSTKGAKKPGKATRGKPKN